MRLRLLRLELLLLFPPAPRVTPRVTPGWVEGSSRLSLALLAGLLAGLKGRGRGNKQLLVATKHTESPPFFRHLRCGLRLASSGGVATSWAGLLLLGGAAVSTPGPSSSFLFNLLLHVAECGSHRALQSWWVHVAEVRVAGQLVEVAVGAELCLARSLVVGVAAVDVVGGVRELGH